MKYVVCSFLLMISAFSFSQKNNNAAGAAKLTGKVVDSATSQPIDYATVTVYADGNDKPISGTTTNTKGQFVIENLVAGNYHAVFDFVGYKSKTKNYILITANSGSINMGTIALSVSAQTLAGVTVTGQKNLIENKIDKMVYNAERDITSQGGVATDLLKKIPMISVDIDGNVELQGNANIRFLINGKPSSIFGNNLADALQSIPASQIKSIEVITVPGAKYDAEGTGGIINIILKSSKIQGINGNINLSAGSRLENGSLNLNARKDNFGLNAYFNGNAQLTSTTLKSLDRTSYDSLGRVSGNLIQNGQSAFTRNGGEAGLGLEWDINKKNNFSAGFGYDNFGNNYDGFLNQVQALYDSNSNFLNNQNSILYPTTHFRGQSMDWNLSYRKTFAQEGQELNVIYSSSYGKNNSSYSQYQNNVAGDSLFSGSNSISKGNDHQSEFQIDYEQPLGKKLKMEAGAKTVIRKITSNTDVNTLDLTSGLYAYDTSQSNSLVYNRNVYAGYGSLSFPLFGFLDMKTGLRYERTHTAAEFSKAANTSIPDYNTWSPSFIVSHTFKSNSTLKISYTKRIQRPDYRSLNPYINASDPKNVTTGNPYLKPEIGDLYELGYAKPFEKGGSLNMVLFYRKSSNDIQPYIVYYPTYKIGDSVYQNVSVNTQQNIGVENNYGLNLYGSVPFTKKLNVRTNLSFFYRHIVNAIVVGSTTSSFNYRINMNATYQLNDNFVMEAFGNFNSPRNEVQGRFPSFTSYNFAFRKQLWHKKGSVGFTTTNPFNKYVGQTTAVTGQGFVLNSTRDLPFRSFGISFMLKFGKLEFKKEKEEKSGGGGGGEENN